MKVLMDILLNAAKYGGENKAQLDVYRDSEHIYTITYERLFFDAKRTASAFSEAGIKKGDYVVFQILDIIGYLYSFWACQVLGAIPVPLPVNVRKYNNSENYNKIQNVRKEISNSYILFEDFQKELYENQDNSICITTVIADLSKYPKHDLVDIFEEDVAFVQFSSGSTSAPKGVVLTHENIIENMRQISERLELEETKCCASWMPLTHDMGFVAFHLMPLKHFAHSILFAPELFVRNPMYFLNVVGQSEAEIIGLSNTMIEMILKIVKSRKPEGLNLSSLSCILNGSEPINCSSAETFVSVFGEYGLPDDCMSYCYGMAEASLVISLSKKRDNAYIRVNTDKYYHEEIEIDDNSNQIIPFVGQPLDGMDIIIIDSDEKILEDGQIGEICIKGKNVMRGYLNKDNEEFFTKTGYFKTGDKGFIFENRVAIVGRIKDIIFKNGVNFYSHDLERIICELFPEMTNKCAVVQEDGKKANMIIFYVDRTIDENAEKFKKMNVELVKRVGFMLEEMKLVKEFPRTEGGKIQRFKLVSNYEDYT